MRSGRFTLQTSFCHQLSDAEVLGRHIWLVESQAGRWPQSSFWLVLANVESVQHIQVSCHPEAAVAREQQEQKINKWLTFWVSAAFSPD